MNKTILGKVSITHKGEYNETTTYEGLDAVSYGGSSYIVLKSVTGVEPCEGEYYTLLASKGEQGLVPKTTLAVTSGAIGVDANTMTVIPQLTGETTLTLSEPIDGFDNEWDFQITQGETAQQLTLPTIQWGLGVDPTFAANTTTLCRLYYIGETLCGEWVCV